MNMNAVIAESGSIVCASKGSTVHAYGGSYETQPGQRIHSMQDLLALELDGKTILKVVDRYGEQEFALCGLITPNPYVNASEGVYIDFEVSRAGVHCSFLLKQKEFDNGTKVFIATLEEVFGRQFSYQNEFSEQNRLEGLARILSWAAS